MMRSSSSAANFDGIISNNNNKFQVDDDEVLLPGFRFHPTDEELVGFYLRRKVEKKAFSIELIKQIDIYKYDPWDLPISTVGDKELYFFCIRERKYRNSVRPNRVTGSGFWKATGIDKPIYSVGGRDHNINNKDHCIIGLKKSLVYYRGSAGKGTKTDWMMHEFRLPPPLIGTAVKSTTNNHQQHHQNSSAKIINSTTHDHQEAAEIWTLCRIFKRNVVSYKNKYPQAAAADCKEELMTSSSSIIQNSSPSTYSSSSSPPPRHHQQSFSLESENRDHQKYNNNKYYCSGLLASNMVHHHQQIIKGKTRQLPVVANHIINERNNINSTLSPAGQLMSCITHHHEPSTTSTSLLQPNHNFQNLNANSDFFSGRDGNWDELGSVVEFMSDQSLLYGYR